MPIPLEQWQERLERHFADLAAARSKSGFPLFALEHGLTHDDVQEIGTMLCSRIRAGLPQRLHWLLWVVYATEFGYNYDGGEYWHPIEDCTVHWDQYRRHQLRAWFRKFHETYGGVVPSGPWAEWFKIIAWPITHSILPKYLQGQFAKALYDLRYRLTQLDTLDAPGVGRLLAENTWDASSRFREFLQQEELAGRIVLALLSDRKAEGQSPIFQPTLDRLVADLEKVRSAREWLKATRRFVADRLKGAGRPSARFSTGRPDEPPRQGGVAALSQGIRPALLLRRSGSSSWSVVLDIPSFATVARLHPDLRQFLKTTRCKIAGAGNTWLPMGWLISGAQKRVLKSWPGAETPLIEFERPNRIIDHLVGSETRISKGSVWLCRINADGLAHEIAGRIVRPNQKYVLLTEAALPRGHPMLGDCTLDCDGINAGILSIPDSVTLEDMKSLHELGLQVARTVRIWPAGLSGRGWDGEGHSEWLTTESPCFGIVHDRPLDRYSLRLNGGAETLIEAGSVKFPVFVRIPPLPVGRHTLAVKAQRGANAYPIPTSPPAEGIVTLEVREPEPWIPGTTSHTGLAVTFDPYEPSLDTFWEGETSVNVLGPEGHNVTCAITLVNTKGAEILSEQIGTFNLPITAADWSKKFSQFVRDERRAWTYLEAASGRFIIRGEELGVYTLRLERDTKPVRWVCRSVHRATTVRLIDDTGSDVTATCRFFSLRSPAVPINLDTGAVLRGYAVQSPGGLFVAQHGEFLDAIVISAPQIERSLQRLGIEPDLRIVDVPSFQVEQMLDLLRLWLQARVVGPLAGIRRGHVITRLANRLYARLCGSKWADAEAAFISNPKSAFALQQLERSVGGLQGFPVILQREHERMAAGMGPGTQWYTEVAQRYEVCSKKPLCEFALRLASQPDQLLALPRAEFEGLLSQLHANSALLRGARLLALLSAANDQNATANTLPRWKW
jgi:hypothetical protein